MEFQEDTRITALALANRAYRGRPKSNEEGQANEPENGH